MKKIIPLVMIASVVALANPVKADITSRFASSVQLSVGGAHTSTDRIGSSFAVSGSGVDTSITPSGGSAAADQVSSGVITSGVYTPGVVVAEQKTAGNAFSFSQSYTQADAVPTGAATVGANPNFSSVTSYASGAKDTLAGTLTSASVIGITAGGAGTTATGQFVSEITVID